MRTEDDDEEKNEDEDEDELVVWIRCEATTPVTITLSRGEN